MKIKTSLDKKEKCVGKVTSKDGGMSRTPRIAKVVPIVNRKLFKSGKGEKGDKEGVKNEDKKGKEISPTEVEEKKKKKLSGNMWRRESENSERNETDSEAEEEEYDEENTTLTEKEKEEEEDSEKRMETAIEDMNIREIKKLLGNVMVNFRE